jgi:NADH-quinone oxidoreductase subunit K
MTIGLAHALYFAAAIFAIGAYGVLVRQNVIVLLMCIEIMLNGVNLALIAVGRALLPAAASVEEAALPQVFVVVVLAVAAAEAAVGLAIVLAVYRKWRTTNAGAIDLMKG